MIYFPAHKTIYENEMGNSLAKVAAKKATHFPQKTDLTMSDLKKCKRSNDNRQMGQKIGRLQFSQIQRVCSSNM